MKDILRVLRRSLPQGGKLPEEVWWSRHRGILVLLWLHAVAIPVYALIRGYPVWHTLLESAIVPSAAFVATTTLVPRRVRTAVASVGLLSSSAVLVHLSGGLIEMHFHFFVMVTVVALYQDWIPFLASIAYVLIHHGMLGALDPSSVFNHPAARADPWRWAGIHAFFIAGISAVCLVTWRLNETVLAQRRAAETRLKEEQARLALMAEAGRVLTSSLELEAIVRNLTRLMVPAVADTCVVDLVEEDGSIRRAASAAAPAIRHLFESIANDAPDPDDDVHPVSRAIRTGRTELIEAVPDSLVAQAIADADHREALRKTRPSSAIIVPLAGRHEILGAVTIGTVEMTRRRFSSENVPLVEELAGRAAIAVENARLYSRQRGAAEALQHSLLPDRLPTVPGLGTAARYIPGGPGASVGGDWYDVLELPDGTLGVAMGDVVGHGVPAASLMGQLRNALRAYALDGYPPVEVMRRLNYMLHDIGAPEHMATLVYATFDPDEGRLRLTNAGHPPPLLIGPEGDASFFEEGGGVPLGAMSAPRYEEASLVLAPGTTLLLYTDGLVEDRSTSLEEGFDRLRSATLDRSHDDLQALCDHVILRSMRDRDSDDDVAVLALRYLPLGDRFSVRVPARPAILKPLRATLRRWLRDAGATEQEMYEILAASGEACANAIRHGSGPKTATFEVEASRDGDVHIVVRDRGRWREPRSSLGGRGLMIMKEFMDEVDLATSQKGTEVTMRRTLSGANGGTDR